MERAAAVGFAVLLLLICVYWVYGYIRRRSKKRY
jgi:Na+-transporting methylmalonyl-CoA/oxaloacetate decarboxylase gamma subunit